MDTLPVVEVSQRIDQFLTNSLPYTRNFFHHIIKRGAVQIVRNETTTICTKKSQKLLPGDRVIVESLERFIDGGILQEAPQRPLDIRYECDEYMIINKPKGVLSHPNSVWDIASPSVVGGVYHYLQDQGLPSMGSFVRAGLVHRLDKETDGLMIIAKTEQGLAHFKALFQQKSTAESIEQKEQVPLKKRYTATAVKTPQGTKFLEQIRDTLPYTIIEEVLPKVPHATAKQGITKVIRIIDENKETVTLLLEILTGRTHQIRVHLSMHGLPIVGDYLYGEEDELPMQLTARKLSFADIDGSIRTVSL